MSKKETEKLVDTAASLSVGMDLDNIFPSVLSAVAFIDNSGHLQEERQHVNDDDDGSDCNFKQNNEGWCANTVCDIKKANNNY